MSGLFKNNASAILATSLSSTATTLVVSAGTGDSFPIITGSNYFFGTLYDSAGNIEIVKVTARLTDTMTIVRGQQNTTAIAFSVGDKFAQRITAGSLSDFAQKSGVNVFSEPNTFLEEVTFDANIDAQTANFSGAITSNSPSFTGSPTAPTAPPNTNTTQIATTAFVITNGVPAGCILLWSGSILTIPSGYYLCDGTNGTPDLRDRFVVGAGSTYGVATTGGSKDSIVVAHSHTATSTVTDPGHNHTFECTSQGGGGGGFPIPGGAGITRSTNSSSTNISVATSVASTGSSGTNANLPPYYALAYIMKGPA